MKVTTPYKRPFQIAALILLITGQIGCYTVLRHPQVANQEAVQSNDTTSAIVQQTGDASCTNCHHNDFNHSWSSSRYNWGFDFWGHNYSNYYSQGYYGWQHYYYDPWWGGYGYGYYDPYPYYQPGPGAPPGVPSPERERMKRGQQYLPPTPQQPAATPIYTPPPPQTQQQGQGQQQNGDDESERRGRRGGK